MDPGSSDLDRATFLRSLLASGVKSGKIEEQKLSIMAHWPDNSLYLVAAKCVLKDVLDQLTCQPPMGGKRAIAHPLIFQKHVCYNYKLTIIFPSENTTSFNHSIPSGNMGWLWPCQQQHVNGLISYFSNSRYRMEWFSRPLIKESRINSPRKILAPTSTKVQSWTMLQPKCCVALRQTN